MRNFPEVNSGSMADVAFTLLIFFLVSTTLATDKGERVRLPEYKECINDECDVDVNPNNVLTIQIGEQSMLTVESKNFPMASLTDETKQFLLNNGTNPAYSDSYEKAVVKLEISEDAAYEHYLETYSRIKLAFTTIRNDAATEQFGAQYEELAELDAKSIRTQFPLKLVEQTIVN